LPTGEWRNSLDGSVLAGTVGLQPWHMLWLEREQS
jgi:amylosucrase